MAKQNRWLVLAIVSSALFLIVVDMTVLYTALPTLTHDLAATASQKLWIVNAYALVVAGLLPGLGALGDRVGHKPMFMGGLVVFGIASLAAAYAPTPAVLIAARGLLAVGAAMMMPATLSIIRITFADEKERAIAIGVWAAVASGGAAFGPVIGGVLLEHFWWGSVFLINVPVVLLAVALGAAIVPADKGHSTRPWDLVGSLQIMVGLIALAFAIKELATREPSLALAAGAALLGIAALVLFVRRQRRSTAPLIDFALFRDSRFSAGVTAALMASVSLVGVELAVSQRLQLVIGLSPLEAAMFILPIPLAAFVSGPLTGIALPRLGPGRVMWMSLALGGAGLAGYTMAHEAATALQLTMLGVFGFGLGAAMTAASSAIMDNAPIDRAGMAASVEEVSYELGGAIGIAVLGSVLTAVYGASFTPPANLDVPATVRDSLDEALLASEKLPPDAAAMLVSLGRAAFDQAFVAVLVVATVLILASAFAIRRTTSREARTRPA
ncbi:MFS transporter [Pseudaminobacter soli (ex Li et al. 2025)]|uniref:MFS transporter n=1 Tax=Pseudaminobacter soli (ex Li et al. 2025) TaxID=1295366 RepID=A0A2P7SA45_9HYPH|nr:MFS transporter [Mesorhizobium soli]PSJ59301.1 MFS transporter [Mesorhizobium soli]